MTMTATPRDVVVTSWSDLCERLYDDAWQDDLRRFRSNYAFRGVSDTAYELSNRFTRQCESHPGLEYHLVRNFRKYVRRDEPEPSRSDWHWLTIAQHHGLPTRLLDWTYSPFVALHFATASVEKFERDGAIWCVDYVRVNRGLPELLSGALREVGANAFTQGMLERALPGLQSFDQLTGGELALFFEPPSLDDRIVNQFALFSVMSSATARLDRWLQRSPELYRRLVIPRKLKWEVRDKLDQANITERTLFPGLDGLAAWLTRHYTPHECEP
jgi:hypothetical protein